MLTTRDAARVLAGGSLDALTALLGFARPLPLGPRDRRSLDPGGAIVRAATAPRHASLRVLTLECRADAPALRTGATAIARTIVARSPQLRWLLLARHPGTGELLIAAPPPDGRGPLPSLLVDLSRVRESDAETLAALAAGGDGDELLVHLRWRETLGRDALSRRFYSELERCVNTLADTAVGRASRADRRTMALLTSSRLLFLAFLEAKGWLDEDRAYLRHGLERAAGVTDVQRRFLEPLFFGTLNTPVHARSPAARALGRIPFLNGGLFTRSGVEKRCRALRFTDDALAAIIGDLLVRFRLTARETTSDLSDAAVDPEMLGRAFESLMSTDARRAQGSFFTPHALTTRIVAEAIASARAGGVSPHHLLVLDPACGSGAFLVATLEMIAEESAQRREVLTRCIHGVDRDPLAVWLCQLRLWLSVVVDEEADDPLRLAPLPNLDRNIHEGDALAGDAFGDRPLVGTTAVDQLRLRYARATGARKVTLARALDRAERSRAIAAAKQRIARLTAERRELLVTARSPDLLGARRGVDATTRRTLDGLRAELRSAGLALRRLRDGGALAFGFATHFPHVAAHGGFDLVIGNPPWVRPHAIPAAERDTLRARFESGRASAWEAGARAAAAGRGFGSQADLAALFTERAVQVTRAGGEVALLLPSKLWCSLAGGGVRAFLQRRCTLLAVDDWGADDGGFDASVYPSAIHVRVRGRDADAVDANGVVLLRRHEGGRSVEHRVLRGRIALDDSPGAPWLLAPSDVRDAFDRLTASGIPLSDTAFGRPLLGVKTGCNDAFVGPLDGIEPELIRPLLRGEDLTAWRLPDGAPRARILWTHDASGAPLASLPPAASRRLSRWRRRLEVRTDGRGARWWALFRTESARSDRPRVVWGDIGRCPRALVLAAGDPTVPLNTCYVVRAPTEEDAHALAALLNSRVARAWLVAIAEPARGGYRRYLGWTCARLPVPRAWAQARATLSSIARAASRGDPPDHAALDRAVAAAYGIPLDALAPLLRWREA